MTSSRLREPPLHRRLFVFALLGILFGCANAAFNHAYREVIQREVDEYRHPGSVEALRSDAEVWLAELGYVPTPMRELGRVETEWQSSDPEHRRSMRIEIAQHPKGLLARVFVVMQELSPPHWASHTHARASEFEAALQTRLIADPERRMPVAEQVYELDADAIWEAATREAFMGPGSFSFGGAHAPVDALAVSSWRENAERSERARLEIRMTRHAAGRYSIEAHERVEHAVGERTWQTYSDARDIDSELAFMRHRDPLGVQKIEAEAQAAGDAAYREAIDRGAIACQCR